MDRKLLTPREVAEQLKVSTSYLTQLRFRGTGPKYVKLSPRKVYYTQEAIDEFIDAQTRQGTAAVAS